MDYQRIDAHGVNYLESMEGTDWQWGSDYTSGDLYADYIYSHNYLDGENLKRFHAFWIKFILAGIADPEKTIDALAEENM